MALETRTAHERIGDGQVAVAVDRVHAEDRAGILRRRARLDAAILFLGVLVGREPCHAMQRDARAVDRRADLPGPIQAVAVPEEAPGGTGAAHIRLDRVAAVRGPLSHEAIGAEEMELVVDLAAGASG